MLIVDKPAGLVTHPAPGHARRTLVNALLALDQEDGGGLGTIAGIQRPGIVHRLDRDTSGLLMVARNDAAQIVAPGTAQGAPGAQAVPRAGRRGRGRAGRAGSRRRSGATRGTGRGWRSCPTAARRSRAIGSGSGSRGWTLLELELVTGRTHQIRVHLASIGHPVAGDQVYATGAARRGPDGLERLFLHAWRLELVSPSRR